MKKAIMPFVFLFILGKTLKAQDLNFAQTVSYIKDQITCCAVPFSGSDSLKVSGIEIAENGFLTIFYSGKKGPLSFNFLQLYKDSDSATGIEVYNNSHLLQFHLSAEKTRTIRFATHESARDVYTAFQNLLKLTKKDEASLDLNFQQTIDVINIRLAKWSEKRNLQQLTVSPNGDVIISSMGKQNFRFNFFDLDNNYDRDAIDEYGMEVVPCTIKAVAALSWINFYAAGRNSAFLRFQCMPDSELNYIYRFLVHLRSLCRKESETILRPVDAMYFVSRDAVLKIENNMLANSIRAANKKDVGDTTFIINSHGEGWLDKDSFPIGQWNFYTKDKWGKEYLFKTGTYSRTNAAMFEVQNMDSTELSKNYGLSYASLQESQSNTIPFIKSANWNFYHSNSRLWKQVYYQAEQIPVEISVSADLSETESRRLVLLLKEDLDEWLNTEVIEYDEEGKQFKKLQYYRFSQVYKKTLYGKNGEVLKQDTAIPYGKEVSAENH